MAYDKGNVYCSVLLDRKGEMVVVLNANGEPVTKVATGDGLNERPAKVGQKAPNGKIVKKIICIEIITLEGEHEGGGSGGSQGSGADPKDPCYIHDRWCNWWCICPGIC